jgi:hypothetical protein
MADDLMLQTKDGGGLSARQALCRGFLVLSL